MSVLLRRGYSFPIREIEIHDVMTVVNPNINYYCRLFAGDCNGNHGKPMADTLFTSLAVSPVTFAMICISIPCDSILRAIL